MLDQIPLQFDRAGGGGGGKKKKKGGGGGGGGRIKEKKGERVGGRLFEGGDYSKYFHRGPIIRGRRFAEGRLLFEEIRYIKNYLTSSPPGEEGL